MKIMVSTIKQKENVEKLITFNVIDEDHQAILGGDDCENLGFVKRVNQLGCCKNFEYDIDFIDNPNFKIIPARKIPYAIQSKVKDEITKMIDMAVISAGFTLGALVASAQGGKFPGANQNLIITIIILVQTARPKMHISLFPIPLTLPLPPAFRLTKNKSAFSLNSSFYI